MCPVSGLAANKHNTMVAPWVCGHMFCERALREVHVKVSVWLSIALLIFEDCRLAEKVAWFVVKNSVRSNSS